MTYGYLYDRYVDHQALLDQVPTATAGRMLRCEECGASGPDLEWLAAHLRTEHPLSAPVVFLDGRALSVAGTRGLRSPIDPDSIEVVNASSVALSVDGRPFVEMPCVELGGSLAPLRHAHVRVRAVKRRGDGAGAERLYELDLDVATEEDLRAVEDAFEASAAVRMTTVGLDDFNGRVARLPGARSYGGAMAAYVRGILLKDGRLEGVALGRSKYVELLNRALHELANYPTRALARAIVGACSFNLNVFPAARSGIAELDRCVSDLCALIAGERPVRGPRVGVEDGGRCPLDDATDVLLKQHEDLGDPVRSRAAETVLLRLAGSSQTTPLDAGKARALVLGLGEHLTREERRRLAASLSANHTFQTLARRHLDGGPTPS